MDLLEEGDLLLQRLDAPLQVQTGQSGSVHILQRFGEWFLKEHTHTQAQTLSQRLSGKTTATTTTHRPEGCQVVFCVLFLEDFFLESDTHTHTHGQVREAPAKPLSSAERNQRESRWKHLKKDILFDVKSLQTPCGVSECLLDARLRLLSALRLAEDRPSALEALSSPFIEEPVFVFACLMPQRWSSWSSNTQTSIRETLFG